jgi:signal transduction histidine kinase
MSIKYFRSLPGRLTILYTGVFGFCFLAVVGVFYATMCSHLHYWTDLELREELIEVDMAFRAQGLPGVVERLRQEEASEAGGFMGRMINSDGQVTYEIVPELWNQVEINDRLVERARSGIHDIEAATLKDGRTVRVIYYLLPEGTVVQLGEGLFDHENWLRGFSKSIWGLMMTALILSVCAGGFMARRALAPIREVARTASMISGQSHGQRVPVSGCGDEVDQLAEAFNGMLQRIDTLINGLQDVTDSLAHDLRTPITGIRGIAEITLRLRREPQEYRMALYQILEQMDRLLMLSDSILDVAEAESGTLPLRLDTVNMAGITETIVQTFAPVADNKGIHLDSVVTPGLHINGDQGRLSQVMANLLDNALKYTSPGGRIRLSVEPHSQKRGILITVSDTGMGISEQDLPHIFERYYRSDKSRSGPGWGLGLPLVQGIVKAHGGLVEVESQLEVGSIFIVFLPFDFTNGER